MEIIGFIVALGVGIAIGMYISSQVIEHIDSRTRHKQFLKDLNEYDNKKKHGTR